MPARTPRESLSEVKTKIVGVTFEGRQKAVARVRQGQTLLLVREPTNPRDKNAILITTTGNETLGHLSANLAEQVAPWLDQGHRWRVRVLNTTGGERDAPTRGVNIVLKYDGGPKPVPTGSAEKTERQKLPWWRRIFRLD